MKKIIFAAVFITALVGAFFVIFIPGEITRDDILKDLETNCSAFTKVGEYFIQHDEITPGYIYNNDAPKYKEIESEIKKSLGKDFLCLKVSADHREIIFETSACDPDNHRLIYSPYDKPKSVSGSETTKFGTWYIKM